MERMRSGIRKRIYADGQKQKKKMETSGGGAVVDLRAWRLFG
jgi:hypothetical protein